MAFLNKHKNDQLEFEMITHLNFNDYKTIVCPRFNTIHQNYLNHSNGIKNNI
jgi:hypothetical protein